MPKSDDACGKHTSFPVSSAPMDLHGKTALVAGGARRVGRAIALELAKCGASVFVHCRADCFCGRASPTHAANAAETPWVI